MTPVSMTAFGRGESGGSKHKWAVEIRSVNHRFCDIKIKMPRKYAVLEEKIKKAVAAVCARGHIEVTINQIAGVSQTVEFNANLSLAREYRQALAAIQQDLGLPESPGLRLIAEYPGIITPAEGVEDLDEIWAEINAALRDALDSCLAMRQDEGRALKVDLLARLAEFEAVVGGIEGEIPRLLVQRETTLKKRLVNLLAGIELDPARLAQEVAILADKSDITEELVRLHSHIRQFRNFMEESKPVGRRLDFILQEFLREINTMAAKINDTTTIHKTVELKNEAEKLREQIQNLE
ncbi:MAG: YicC family protein [Deltaproteobacteria bacterium]|nr:YicC family protein [Deltaproteobacteria bacterium]